MGELRLTFVNVGYGEAMVLECPDPASRGGTFVMVIDGGSAEPEEYAGGDGRLPLDAYLALRGVDHIDLMAATHIHEDHLCGLLPAAERLRPAVLWQPLPPGSHRFMRPLAVPEDAAPTQAKFIRALNDCRKLCMAMEGRLVRPEAGMERTLCPGLTVRVLGPSAGRAGELERLCREIYREADPSARQQRLDRLDAAMNNFSLILSLDYRGPRILLPGDTNRAGYGEIPEAALRADLFKVGHHGQRDGASIEQIRAIRPRMAVCCASSDRRYNSADPGILRMMADSGAELYFSDCPPGPDGTLPPPHRALEFRTAGGGTITAAYHRHIGDGARRPPALSEPAWRPDP